MVQLAMLMACWIVWQGVPWVPQVGMAHCPVQLPLDVGRAVAGGRGIDVNVEGEVRHRRRRGLETRHAGRQKGKSQQPGYPEIIH